MTAPVIRPAAEADWPAISALLDRLLGRRDGAARERLWRWRSEANPARPTDFPVFLVADRGGTIVGTHGLLPVRLLAGGNEVLVACACDFAVDPDARGVGLPLKLKAMDPSLAPIAMSTSANEAANKVTLALKGKQLDAAATTWLKPLRAGGLLGQRTASPALRAAIGSGLALPDLALRGGRALARSVAARGPAVKRAERFDERHDALWERVRARGGVMMVRDAAYLRWRYGEYPFGGIETYQVFDGGQVRGLAVAHHWQDAAGLAFTAVLELYDDANDPAVLRSLLGAALAAADRRGSHYVTAKASAPAHAAAYEAARFMRRRSGFSPVTYRTRDPALGAELDRPEAWTIALGDGDLAFYLPGQTRSAEHAS